MSRRELTPQAEAMESPHPGPSAAGPGSRGRGLDARPLRPPHRQALSCLAVRVRGTHPLVHLRLTLPLTLRPAPTAPPPAPRSLRPSPGGGRAEGFGWRAEACTCHPSGPRTPTLPPLVTRCWQEAQTHPLVTLLEPSPGGAGRGGAGAHLAGVVEPPDGHLHQGTEHQRKAEEALAGEGPVTPRGLARLARSWARPCPCGPLPEPAPLPEAGPRPASLPVPSLCSGPFREFFHHY